MLTALRQNVTNPIFLIPIAVIIFVFIFTFGSWGGGDVSGSLPMAAVVNGRVIPEAQFHVVYAQQFQQRQQFQRGYTVDNAKADGLKQTVVDQLIDRELLAQSAQDRGLVVADEALRKFILDNVFGGEDFDQETYERFVSSRYQTTPPRFEEQIRRDILAQRMQGVIQDSLHVSPAELKDEFDARFNRVDVHLVRVDPLFFKDVGELSDDEVKAWASENAEEIEKYYNEHINRYREQEQIKARHILIKVAEGADTVTKDAARKKAEEARKRVTEGGEDFAAVATELSEDPGSGKNGGDLGTFPRGRMVKPFEEAAFALEAGKVSAVVESKFGFHVIKVEEKIAAKVQELDAVREQIAKQLSKEGARGTKAKALAQTALDQLKAGKKPEELEVEGLLLPKDLTEQEKPDPFAPRLENTGWFAKNARYVPRVGVSEDMVKAAFALTTENPVHGEVIEVSSRYFVIALKDKEAPDPGKFEEERGTIRDSLLRTRQVDAVKDFVKSLRKTATIELNARLLGYGA
jgi:peptidyl-prolyl cis-trans isomerase D